MKKLVLLIFISKFAFASANLDLSFDEVINSTWGPSDFKSSVKFNDEFEKIGPTCSRTYELLYNGEFDYRQGVFQVPDTVKKYAVLRYKEYELNMEDYHKDNTFKEELEAKIKAIRSTKGCFSKYPTLSRKIGEILIETINKLKAKDD